MVDARKIDLHMHTTVSDGTDTPQQILTCAKDAGLSLFAVTDHDAIKAGRIIRELLADGDPRFLTGVEFSCRDGEGKYHILGYHYDPDAESINRVVETGHNLRMKKVETRIQFLISEFHMEFPEEEVAEILAMDNPGKPHIANMMIRHGYAESRDRAIKEYINKLHVKADYLLPEEAIRCILGAGGIPVLAHPAFGSGDELIIGDEMEQRLLRLMDYGLQGIEAFYSGFTLKLRTGLLNLAEKYHLYVTAGSDYHGKTKLVRIGDTGLSDADTLPDGLYRFLEAIAQ